MATNVYRINHWPMAPAPARDFLRMQAAAAKDGVNIQPTSAYRTKSEQTETFLKRYTQGAWSPWNDYRTFRGLRWGRTSGEGTVQSPDVGSNHTFGYAADIYMGPGVYAWLKKNAARFGFNHIEGASVNEPWHWVWKVGIRPTGSSPDPWDGRGAPDPVYSSDPGLSYNELMAQAGGNSNGAGGGAEQEEDDMFTDSDRAKIEKLLDQVGGSESRVTSLRQDVDKILKQLGGSDSRKTSLRQDVDAVGEEVSVIRKLIGSTVARAKAGDTLGTRMDKIIAHLGGRKKLGPKD